jgi:hypothetical protein
VKALFDVKSKPPDALKLTGYDPATGKSIENDDYGHDGFAKDSPRKNPESKSRLGNGQTKFQAARDAAVNYSGEFLARAKASMGDDKWKRITGLETWP